MYPHNESIVKDSYNSERKVYFYGIVVVWSHSNVAAMEFLWLPWPDLLAKLKAS